MPEEPSGPEHSGYWRRASTELVTYALLSVIVLYLLSVVFLLTSIANGTFSERTAVLAVIGLGLLAPVCLWAFRAAVVNERKQSSRREPGVLSRSMLLSVWQRVRRLTQPLRLRRAGGAQSRPDRTLDVGVAVISVALFWALYAGSLVAAVIVPVTVHWVLRRRLRR